MSVLLVTIWKLAVSPI